MITSNLIFYYIKLNILARKRKSFSYTCTYIHNISHFAARIYYFITFHTGYKVSLYLWNRATNISICQILQHSSSLNICKEFKKRMYRDIRFFYMHKCIKMSKYNVYKAFHKYSAEFHRCNFFLPWKNFVKFHPRQNLKSSLILYWNEVCYISRK